MAGGKGTRLQSLTNNEIPKPMAPVAGKPILQWQIEYLRDQDVSDIIRASWQENTGVLSGWKPVWCKNPVYCGDDAPGHGGSAFDAAAYAGGGELLPGVRGCAL